MSQVTRMRIVMAAFCAAWFALTLPLAASDRGRGRHGQLYVTPAPGAVTIDGQLEDWDLSGQIEMFVLEATRSTQSARLAAMYDKEALYISGEVRDPNPMMNRHDPQVKPHRAWDADACQFRLVIDGDADYPVEESAFRYRGKNPAKDTRDDIVHILMWHYTDDATAHLQMHLGMGYRTPREEWGRHGLVPHGLFDGAYRKWDNGRGYTFEYRIPWATFGTDDPPTGGDVVAGTAQVHWSRPDGLSTGGGRAWAYDIMRAPGFPFQSAACWGRLIFSETGDVPEELVLEGLPPERPLALEFEYELPDDGEATIQLMNEKGIVSRILVAQQERLGGVNVERWDGMDNHGTVEGHGDLAPAGTYQVMGTYNPERLRVKYRFSVHNSGQPPYMSDDGTGGWGGDHGTPQDVAALPDGLLLCWSGAEHGFPIIRVDLKGRKQWGSSGRQLHARHLATDGERVYYDNGGEVAMLTVSDSRPARLPGGAAVFAPPAGGEKGTNRITGLACGDGTLYVAYGGRDLVARFSTEDATLLGTHAVPAAGPLAVRPDGSLAAVSGGRVVTVADGKVTPWLTTHLDEPVGLAVAADGTACVANRGKLQNVSVFAADGAFQRSIGKAGGRPAMGAYDPAGMYMPGGIAISASGELWVAETQDAPKRISVWDLETGRNVREFFGAASYFAYGTVDPARPDEIYAHNVLWKIDWDKYTVRPLTTIWRQTEPNMAPHPNVDGHTGVFRMMTAKNGRQFATAGTPHGRQVMIYLRDGDLFRPMAGIINPWARKMPALDEMKATLEKQWDDEGLRSHQRPRNLFWQDGNGDGYVSADEVTVRDSVGSPMHLDADLTLWLSCGRKVAPRTVTDKGRPLYDLADAEETPLMGKMGSYGWTSFDDDGNVYTVSVTQRGKSGAGLTRWSPDGALAWRFPDIIRWRDAIGLSSAGPGRLWSMTKSMGVAGDYLATQTYMGVNHIFRRDGMYIGAVLGGGPRGVLDPKLTDARYTSQPEGQGGSFVKLTIDGEERHFLIHGGHDVRVWEVLGLDTLQDLPEETYVHTEAQVAAARKAHEEYLAKLEGETVIRIAKGREALAAAKPVSVKVEGNRGFRARLARDDTNLYVQFQVEAPHGLINTQADPHVVFRGGNLLDIQLATDPKADPERDSPAPGDLRLLVTRQDGAPHAVLFRPRVAGFDGERIVLTSPTGEEPFDRIEVVDWVGLDYEETDLGFAATVTIPLEKIGLALDSGDIIGLDLGYVFGNSGGTRAVERAYVFNNSFSASVVDDVPNESRVEPDEWGTAQVE
ncbi:MAG: hypothetical protein ACOCX4_04985 [Planctomycetota bacterium]